VKPGKTSTGVGYHKLLTTVHRWLCPRPKWPVMCRVLGRWSFSVSQSCLSVAVGLRVLCGMHASFQQNGIGRLFN